MQEALIVERLKNELHSKGYKDRQILLEFDSKLKGHHFVFDLVVLSRDNRKIMIFEIGNNFNRFHQQCKQYYDVLIKSKNFDSIDFFMVNEDLEIKRFVSNERIYPNSLFGHYPPYRSTIPYSSEWDDKTLPETRILSFEGSKDISLLALTSYLVTCTQNYFKFLNLDKLLELYILGEIDDS